jgi:hypothetical protein
MSRRVLVDVGGFGRNGPFGVLDWFRAGSLSRMLHMLTTQSPERK